MNLSTGAPPYHFFHYIKDVDAATNAADFVQMVDNYNETGIFFVDGDLDGSAPNKWDIGSGGQVTLIATGEGQVGGGNESVGTAGKYAFGISVLAGGSRDGSIPPTNPDLACATPAHSGSNWVLHWIGQQSGWKGIIYVPNGLFWINTDWHSSPDPQGPI